MQLFPLLPFLCLSYLKHLNAINILHAYKSYTTETRNKKQKKGEYKLDQNSKCYPRNDKGNPFVFCVTGKSLNHPEGIFAISFAYFFTRMNSLLACTGYVCLCLRACLLLSCPQSHVLSFPFSWSS